MSYSRGVSTWGNAWSQGGLLLEGVVPGGGSAPGGGGWPSVVAFCYAPLLSPSD